MLETLPLEIYWDLLNNPRGTVWAYEQRFHAIRVFPTVLNTSGTVFGSGDISSPSVVHLARYRDLVNSSIGALARYRDLVKSSIGALWAYQHRCESIAVFPRVPRTSGAFFGSGGRLRPVDGILRIVLLRGINERYTLRVAAGNRALLIGRHLRLFSISPRLLNKLLD